MKILSAVLLAVFMSSLSSPQSVENYMFRGNATHTGVYDSGYKGSPKEFAWSFRTDGAVRSTPLYYKGEVFIGSTDNNLYALNSKTGELNWKFKTGGPVNSSPAIDDKGNVFFLSADNYLYSVNAVSGILNWKFKTGTDLPYKWSFDYLLSSPAVSDNEIYFGSGDGNLYSIDKNNGSLNWKYFTGSRVRSSPAVYKNSVLFGDVNGHFYSLNSENGSLVWEYDTKGGVTQNNMGEESFDRSAVISSPAVEDDIVCFGGRDGFLYALNAETGRELWTFDHKVSWVISTPAILNGIVYTGSSDGHFVQAIDLYTGKEIWRYNTSSLVWGSPAISGNQLYFGDGVGKLYQLDLKTGEENWSFKFRKWILSSPVLFDDVLCFGCDDGYIYALNGNGGPINNGLLKAVFWEDTSGYKWFKNGIDVTIKNYFVSQGYELLGSKELAEYFNERIKDKKPSVVIFASNKIPNSVVPDSSNQNLFRKYLSSGGKALVLGTNPLGYIRDPKTDKLVSIDYTVASKILDVHYKGTVTDALRGLYSSFPTTDGKKLGLNHWWTGFGGVDPEEVTTVLALNEIGEATAWIKNYGGPAGTGLIQLRIDNAVPEDLTFIQQIAEFTQ